MHKMKIIRGTTLAGKEVKPDDIVDVDAATRSTFLSQEQAVDFVEVKKPAETNSGETKSEPKEKKK